MWFRDKGLGFRFEQRVNMPSAPATSDPPLAEREKEGLEKGVGEKKTVGERGRWIERLRERVRDGEKEKERERESESERETDRQRWVGERR